MCSGLPARGVPPIIPASIFWAYINRCLTNWQFSIRQGSLSPPNTRYHFKINICLPFLANHPISRRRVTRCYLSVCCSWHMRPDPNVRRRNRALLELVLGPEVPNDPHWEVANHLLNLDTGSWGDAHIWHHCTGLFCCRTGIRETRLKIFTAVLEPCLGQWCRVLGDMILAYSQPTPKSCA